VPRAVRLSEDEVMLPLKAAQADLRAIHVRAGFGV
jgi:hypothetical protein